LFARAFFASAFTASLPPFTTSACVSGGKSATSAASDTLTWTESTAA
jgi:hypothetical protein